MQNPLTALEEAFGMQGMSVRIPPITSRIRERQVPLVAVMIVGLFSLFIGWRVIAIAAIFYVVNGLSESAREKNTG